MYTATIQQALKEQPSRSLKGAFLKFNFFLRIYLGGEGVMVDWWLNCPCPLKVVMCDVMLVLKFLSDPVGLFQKGYSVIEIERFITQIYKPLTTRLDTT